MMALASDAPAARRGLPGLLTPLQARVLGVLAEKQATVPDTYPLSLNALTLGCNQKTARNPVMNASEAEVLAALDGLRPMSLVFEVSGSRVARFEHNLGRVLGVPGQAVALLALLMLRGPLTAAELRQHTERLHRFADTSSVEGFLDELAAAQPPLVLKLPRGPGEREARWAHLLCGPLSSVAAAAPAVPAAGAPSAAAAESPPADALAALQAEQQRLSGEVARLQRQLAALAAQLGVELP